MEPNMELETLPARPRVTDEVYGLLVASIFDRRLKPGTRLSVPALASQLGVSRTPVREAIIRLIREGMAAEEPRRGAVVAELRTSDLVSIYELREALEGLAAALAADRVEDVDLGSIEAAFADHRKVVAGGQIDALFRADMAFHHAIWVGSGNLPLLETLEQVQAKVRIAMLTTASVSAGPARALKDHAKILDAIRDGDRRRADAAAREHIERLRKLLERRLWTASPAPLPGESDGDTGS